ncbi:MAG TPA: phospholipase A2 [Allocoleopsis sp.]
MFTSKQFKGISLALATCLGAVSINLWDTVPTLATHTEVNGCGSGPTGKVTPNAPAGVSFEEACNNHDRCYGIIGKSQQDCDKAFHKEMLDKCARKFKTIIAKPLRASCNGAADVYYSAVKKYGGTAYRAAQDHARKSK